MCVCVRVYVCASCMRACVFKRACYYKVLNCIFIYILYYFQYSLRKCIYESSRSAVLLDGEKLDMFNVHRARRGQVEVFPQYYFQY